jgi:outer membrane lipoprotein carrier protein
MNSFGLGRALRWRFAIGAVALVFVATTAGASGLDQLHAFLEGTSSAQGTFRQTVVNKDRRTTQTTSGTFAFQRPGKFRWTYDKPVDQLIVGDGEKVWVHDRDLNQVIVRKLDAALGATPAALLAGDNALERNFTLVAGGEGDGIEYVNATPKSPESQFTRIRLGFVDNLPRRMELTDAFGQSTELTFADVRRNPRLNAETFQFSPPKGADVVGQ